MSSGILSSLTLRAKTAVDLSGSLMLPSPNVPCSLTPPQSPATSPLAVTYYCLPATTTLSACGFLPLRGSIASLALRPARRSCLRLAHVVTSISPRLDSRWGGSSPCRGGNHTRWKHQAWPDAP
jgi:hypothetical protein